jgi:hypothetical protein
MLDLATRMRIASRNFGALLQTFGDRHSELSGAANGLLHFPRWTLPEVATGAWTRTEQSEPTSTIPGILQ